MKVALYARVSSHQQEKQGTIESQVAAFRRHAGKEGFAIADDFVCLDDGVSGARLDRPGLDRLRDGAEAGRFDSVLVLSPDRLSRKYAYLILILEEFERLGVPILFLEQPPADDPHSSLLIQIQGAVAEYERAKITERHRRGKLHRARQGEIFWNSVPLGYQRVPRRDGVPAHVVLDEERHPWCARSFIGTSMRESPSGTTARARGPLYRSPGACDRQSWAARGR
jgi:site-specific DNA recombinase